MPFISTHKKPSDLDPLSLALTFGILTSISILFIGILSAVTGYASLTVEVIGDSYIGFNGTLIGAVIGTVWGFLDGFIGGYIVALLYNFIKNRRT